MDERRRPALPERLLGPLLAEVPRLALNAHAWPQPLRGPPPRYRRRNTCPTGHGCPTALWRQFLPPGRQERAARAPQQRAERCALRPRLPPTGATPQISRPVLGALMLGGARKLPAGYCGAATLKPLQQAIAGRQLPPGRQSASWEARKSILTVGEVFLIKVIPTQSQIQARTFQRLRQPSPLSLVRLYE